MPLKNQNKQDVPMEKTFKKMPLPQRHVANALDVYKRLLQYVRRYWVAIIIAIIASMLYSGVNAWFIGFLKPLINRGLIANDQRFLARAPWLVMGVFIIRGIASFFSNYYIASASRNVILSLRKDLFAQLQKLPANYYDKATSGQLLSILLYSVDQVANASADVLTTLVQASFLIIYLVGVMFTTSWKLTLIYFVTLPVVTVIMRITSRRVRSLSLDIQDSVAEMSHRAEENIEGYKVVRAFEGQSHEIEKFNKSARSNQQREMKVVVTRSLSTSIVQLITAAAMSIIIYIASKDILHSILSPGDFFVIIGCMITMLNPMKDLAFVQNKIYRGLAGAQSVFEVIDHKAEEDTGTKTLARAKGLIKFSHVNFTYHGNKEVLHDINFEIQPGQIVAIIGRSGSGKTTIASLLPRFYSGYSGEILLDDVSILEYKIQDLRRQFALVSQNVTLFQDTIYNNIAYGRFDKVSEREVLAAAQASYAMEFIEKLPEGINTPIGENGVLLSGGQRQRIAIARAILKDAPILILDEATSALDTESERYIQAALEDLMKTRTTLVIAHRLSTIEHANKIIVMDEGRIIEQGTHQHLIDVNGHYAKLHNLQFKDVTPHMEVVNAFAN